MVMKKKNNPDTFDTRLARLQEIVALLEAGALPLEEGIALYKEGMGLSKACREQLERARNEIQLCTESGLQAFEPENGADEGGVEHG
jgi:exodeoxyribonuclease VII small subunit